VFYLSRCNGAEGTKGRAEGLPTNPAGILAVASCSKRRLCARRMAAPNILVMLAQASTGLVETYFVGKLGTDALAGVALVLPWCFPASC
jgi:hypothetical protein